MPLLRTQRSMHPARRATAVPAPSSSRKTPSRGNRAATGIKGPLRSCLRETRRRARFPASRRRISSWKCRCFKTASRATWRSFDAKSPWLSAPSVPPGTIFCRSQKALTRSSRIGAAPILRSRAIDNIDALVNPFETFYRKEGLAAPDNGFASFAKLSQTAADLGYRMDTAAKKYVHIRDEALLLGGQRITLGYPYPSNAVFDYNPQTNMYLRSRGGKKELDGQTQKQVEVKNLIVMTASSRQVSKDY